MVPFSPLVGHWATGMELLASSRLWSGHASVAQVCTSCREGDLLDGSVCKSKCPAGKYAKEGRRGAEKVGGNMC